MMCKYTAIGFTLQCLFLSLIFASDSKAQNKSIGEIFLDFRAEGTVFEIFEALENETGFKFSVNHSNVKKRDFKQNLAFNEKSKSLRGILEKLSAQTELKFQRINQSIHVDYLGIHKRRVVDGFADMADKDITGKITDENGEGLPGASVVVKGTTNGTTTNLEGNFRLTAPEEAILTVSYVGYKTQEVSLAGRSVIDLAMVPDAEQLDEIVVIGYGTKKKSDVTGAVTTVNQDFLKQQPSASVTRALQGSASGVTVVSTSTPGANAEVRIRGLGTINNNDPLWVVDGVFDAEIPPPNQIQSIQVLKDASSTAIYGARGANGVILVTTKTGRANQKAKVEFSIRTGVYDPTAKFDILTNPIEIGQMIWLEQYNDYQLALETDPNAVFTPTHPHFNFTSTTEPNVELYDYLFPNSTNNGAASTNLDLYEPRNYPITRTNKEGTDWLEEVYEPGLTQDYNVSITGGSESTRYGFHGNYYTENAQYKFGGYDRYAFRANIDTDINDWFSVGQRLGGTLENFKGYRSNNSRGLLKNMMEISPIIPMRDEAGNYAGSIVGGGIQDAPNPVAHLERLKNNFNRETTVSGNFYATIKPIEGLSAKTLFGYNIRGSKSTGYELPAPEFNNGVTTTALNNGNSNNLSWNWSNTVSYQNNFQEYHSINVLLGVEARKNTFDFNSAFRSNFFSTDIDYLVLDAGSDAQQNSGSRGGSSTSSVFARAYYDYKGKYLVDATIRRDGSSIFREDNRFGTFPAVSVGWKISDEAFLNGSSGWLNLLKFRAGWGQSGNDRTGNVNNQYTLFNQSLGSSFYAIDGSDNNIAQGFQSSNYGNPNARWETTATTNVAIDATMFGALSINLDVWQKKTNDMLLRVPIPAVVGQAAIPSVNIGDMENKGFDLTIDYASSALGKELKYNVSWTFSRYKNTVTKLSGQEEEPPILGSSLRGATYTQVEAGRSFPEFYGYQIDGIFQTDTEAAAHATNGTYNRPGNLIVRDVNGDGEITPDDRTYIGNPHPDFTTGLRAGLEYKGFDLSMTFYASVGHDIANYLARFRHYGLFQGPKSSRRLYESWGSPFLADNSQATLPRAYSSTGFEQFSISEHIEDGSFLRLQNLQVGYNLPPSVLETLSLESARIYVMGSNLFTITGYSGLDPEIPSNWGPDGVDPAFNKGIDIGAWPIARQFMIGVNFSF
ncbi:MAG: TonB-dependent receptor [Cyclobacteriaceae bacterium]